MPNVHTLKSYSSPTLNRLTAEQAKLLLIGQATQDDQGARDLLDVLFPNPNEHETVSPRIEKPEGFVTQNPSRHSRLFFHAVVVLESVRQSFYRLVRG